MALDVHINLFFEKSLEKSSVKKQPETLLVVSAHTDSASIEN